MRILICLFASLWACRDAAALSPPWYILWNEIRYTIGRDPGVQVDPLDTSTTPYLINIRVQDFAKAQALASVLIPARTFGNVGVAIHVAGATPAAPSSSGGLADTLRTAFETNPLFVSAYASSSSTLIATFSKSIVQFCNDDLGKAYGNYIGQCFRSDSRACFMMGP
jgi:hypothetical protein